MHKNGQDVYQQIDFFNLQKNNNNNYNWRASYVMYKGPTGPKVTTGSRRKACEMHTMTRNYWNIKKIFDNQGD